MNLEGHIIMGNFFLGIYWEDLFDKPEAHNLLAWSDLVYCLLLFGLQLFFTMRDKPKGGGLGLPWLSLVSLMTFGMLADASGNKMSCFIPRSGHTIYNYTLMDIHQQRNVSLQTYEGKVVLFVNVASF